MPEELPSFSFENGALHIVAPGQRLRLIWDRMPLAEERLHNGKWGESFPALRLLKPAAGPVEAGPVEVGPGEKQRAYAAFRERVEPEVVQLVEPFPGHQWALMLLLHYSQAARELTVSNPVLAHGLANVAGLLSVSDRIALDKARPWIRRRQREICGFLGFPEAEAMVRLFRRIPPEACSPPMLRLLRLALRREPERLKELGHLPRIHRGVVCLLAGGRVSELVSGELLRQVSEADEEMENARTADRLFDICYAMSRIGNPEPLPAFRSRRRVEEYHNDLGRRLQEQIERQRQAERQAEAERRQRRRREQEARRERVAVERRQRLGILRRPFPPPPFPGTEDIVPLASEGALNREGDEQGNCVGCYDYSVKSGGLYVYKVLRPHRATLAIRQQADGSWRITEFELIGRHRPSLAMQAMVDDWLGRHNVSV